MQHLTVWGVTEELQGIASLYQIPVHTLIRRANNWNYNCVTDHMCMGLVYVKLYTEPLPTHLSDLDHFELFLRVIARQTNLGSCE